MSPGHGEPTRRLPALLWLGTAVIAPLPWLPAGAAADQALPATLPSQGFVARKADDTLELPRGDAERLRKDALTRAVLWRPAPEPAELSNLQGQPDDFFGHKDSLVCKFRPGKTSGSTPKFDCVFEGGELLKVKYGGSPEIHSEVAATRLMQALGAGADRMYFVERLRCFGCPEDPQAMLRCISSPFAEQRRDCVPLYGVSKASGEVEVDIDYGRYADFTNVAIERRLEGRAVKADGQAGWGWNELAEVQQGNGRAERDALRLLAVFLNNWDNRPDNQRLVCIDDGAKMADGGCHAPLAYMQDVGATFGYVGAEKSKRKLDVEGWQAVPIWKDAARCVVSIRSPRLHGATFEDATISESGRAFLAARLSRLGRDQVRALFEGARFDAYEGASPSSRSIDRWVSVFEQKVRAITQRPPCPVP
jgi:hypothetical protein